MDVIRDPPFLFTGSQAETEVSFLCPTIDFDDRCKAFF